MNVYSPGHSAGNIQYVLSSYLFTIILSLYTKDADTPHEQQAWEEYILPIHCLWLVLAQGTMIHIDVVPLSH